MGGDTCRYLFQRLFLLILFWQVFSEPLTHVTRKKTSKETNIFNFLRLILFRMIYGFATMFGVQETLSEFMGGIFVPPGAEEEEYRDYLDVDVDEGEDEDDFDYR